MNCHMVHYSNYRFIMTLTQTNAWICFHDFHDVVGHDYILDSEII